MRSALEGHEQVYARTATSQVAVVILPTVLQRPFGGSLNTKTPSPGPPEGPLIESLCLMALNSGYLRYIRGKLGV